MIYLLTILITISIGPFEQHYKIDTGYPFKTKIECDKAATNWKIINMSNEKLVTFDSIHHVCIGQRVK
jgi:hypothetical protein